MPCFAFASISHPDKYGYKFDSSNWSSNSGVSRKFLYFETYGDGSIQHAPDRPITWELLTDYLQSLGAAMLSNAELVEAAEHEVSQTPDADDLAFAASVVFKESDKDWSKRRYFSVQQKKIGGRKFEYDKRYTELRDWHDGSRAATYRMLAPEYADGFQLFQISEAVREFCDAQKHRVATGENWPNWLDGEHRSLYRLRNALNACRYICQAAREMRCAKSIIDYYIEEAAREKAASSIDSAA
jgi:hypothetical protein